MNDTDDEGIMKAVVDTLRNARDDDEAWSDYEYNDRASALLRDLARLQRPVATLHDDGYWTLNANHPDHAKHRDESDYAGWKLKVYSSLPGADAPVCRLCGGTKIWHGAQCNPSKRHPTGYKSIDCPECTGADAS